MSNKAKEYDGVIQGDEDLVIFIRRLEKFNQQFTDAMVSGVDFTLKMEVRGDKGKLIHCRSNVDEFDRPIKVQEEIVSKRRLPGPK